MYEALDLPWPSDAADVTARVLVPLQSFDLEFIFALHLRKEFQGQYVNSVVFPNSCKTIDAVNVVMYTR